MKIIIKDNETRERVAVRDCPVVPRVGDWVRVLQGGQAYQVQAVMFDFQEQVAVIGVKKTELAK